jgi:transposase
VGDEATSTLFGMAGFRVLAVDEHDGSVNVLVELQRHEAPCPGCGTFSARVKQRPVVALADAPIAGRKVKVFWRKRRLRCDEEFCDTKTFTQQAPEHVAMRGRLTERLRALVAKAARCRSVAEVAAEHGLGWRTVWRAVQAAIEAALAGSTPPRCAGSASTRPASVARDASPPASSTWTPAGSSTWSRDARSPWSVTG